MKRGSGLIAVLSLLGLAAAACNGNDVVSGASPSNTPTPSATLTATPPPSPSPSPSPTDSPTPTPTPSATPTPVPCQFYGVDSASNLWVIDPVHVTATMIGATGVSSMSDIAITPDNRIIGITSTKGYQIDPSTGAATEIASAAWLVKQDALDALPDGRLLVGGDADLVAVDTTSGMVTTIGSIAGGRVFSGDVAANGSGIALGTAKVTSGTANDHLISFDLATHAVTDLGDLGYAKVFGLDFGCDGTLYGMVASSPPKLLAVDPSTAQTTLLGTMTGGPTTLWGAAGPAGN